MRFADSHLHIEGPEAPRVLALAEATGILLGACGVDRETSENALRQAESRPRTVKAFVGVHPSEAVKEGDLGWVRYALGKAAGLGEVGLDPKYSPTGPRSAQQRVLRAQLDSVLGKKPVQIHSRDAERECLDTLGGYRLGPVLMHWFQDETLLREVQDRGYFVSFGPSLLYSKKLQRMAARFPHTQVLTETDSPVAFGPLGDAHGPQLVPSVVFRLSELWGERFEDAGATLFGNAERFLGLSEKG